MRLRWLRSLLLATTTLICASGAVVTQASPAVAPVTEPREPLVAQLQRAADGQAQIWYHSQTGKVRLILPSQSHPIARSSALAASATPEQAARSFLATYGTLFGVENPTSDLTVMRSETAGKSSFTRFQQQFQGVPVVGGELIVQTNTRGDVVSASGEALPITELSIVPKITATAAAGTARSTTAQRYDLQESQVTASEPALWVYSPALLGAPGSPIASLVWRTEVRGTSEGVPFREFVMVNARDGKIALNFNQIAYVKERHVCNDNNVVDADGDETNNCTPDKYVRSEGDGPTGNVDVDEAYNFSGDTYDFYFSKFGRDSLDNAGLPLISLVKYCPPGIGNCPYQNAFWDGQQMTYGDGFAAADDVVAHELTHGFTEFSSQLFYYYQSGAINEAMSDIFGELIDLQNGAGTDTPAVRWELGEDLPGIGAIRNMKDPAEFGQPDRMNSELYVTDAGLSDQGGVHTNSGVANKSLYLLVDGDTFNGQTINPIGADKAAQLFYAVNNNLLTSGSDYQDLAGALRTACSTLTGQFGITAGDCAEVEKTIIATEMDQIPVNAPAYEAPICNVGQTPTTLFADNLENPALGNWASAPVSGDVNVWSYPQNEDIVNIFGGKSYATSGKLHIYGADFDAAELSNRASDSAIAMTKDVAIPANSVLHFRHAYDFGRIGTHNYSGGFVEYSTDSGANWLDAGGLFTTNGYNTVLETGFDNPLGKRAVFGGTSYGYTASRLALDSLAGKNVRFRFHIGTQAFVSYIGWFIDDISITSCAGAAVNSAPRVTPSNILTVNPGENATTTNVAVVSDNQDLASSLQVSTEGAPEGLVIGLSNNGGIITAKVKGLCTAAAGSYNVTIRVRDSGGLESTSTFVVNVEQAGQKIVDPSFEDSDGNFRINLNWNATAFGTGALLCDTSFCATNATTGPKTGNWWARFGGPVGIESTGSVSQTVSWIGNDATLEFYIKVGSHSGGGANDYVKAYIGDTAVFTVTDDTTEYDGTAFTKVTVDISDIGPGTHALDFREHNDAGAAAFRVHIDDVRIVTSPNACVGLYPRQSLPFIAR